MKLRLDSTQSVPMYHKTFELTSNAVFRVIATETIMVPAGHAKILPAHIPDWKKPPIPLNAIFEPLEKFNSTREVVAPNILFNYSEETIPIVFNNTASSDITIYKNTTLESSEIVSEDCLNNVSQSPLPRPSQKPNQSQVKTKKSMKYDLESLFSNIDEDIDEEYQQQFKDLVKEFEHVFSSSEWDLGKCDVTSHKIEVYPGSRPVKIPNRRMPLHYKEDLQNKIDVFLDKELITPCHSPYSSPTMLVPKKNGKLRLVEHDGLERAICYASKSFSKAQSKYSATRRELLAIVNFTRQFRHYLLGQKFTNVTDHRALQWLHNFKDPDGITARWLEKLAPFNYEVRHRPGKSIGHADGLSRSPSVINVITDQSTPAYRPGEDEPVVDANGCDQEWPNRDLNVSTPVIPDLSPTGQYREVSADLFSTKNSFAHCVSADFKMSSGIARKIKRNFPIAYPTNLDHTLHPIWPQWLPDSQRYIYHLITKQKQNNKTTYGTLRASLERMRAHAEQNTVKSISIPCAGCGVDCLDEDKICQLIRETFRTSTVQITVYLKEFARSSQPNHNGKFSGIGTLQELQEADEALRHVRAWVRASKTPTTSELQGLPRLAWRMYNQLGSLYLHNDILCRKFEPNDGSAPFLQQIVPHVLIPEVLESLHSSSTAGHLGTYKVIEKVRQRFYWPGFKEDDKLFIRCCDICQKRSNPPKTHRHSLVDWKVSYPFHHIGMDFLGPLPLSNGNQYILLIGDHFTKWYEAIPLPDQQATTTANALLQHWICRFGCPYSIHTDQGRNFESDLFQHLMRRLEIDKTRTTSFHPQSNSIIERMNRTLLNMLSKCIADDQSNWSSLLPFVLLAYRSSVHESTGFTPNFLVFGHELTLPNYLMYKGPQSTLALPPNNFVLQKQALFHKAFELVRHSTNAQQLRRNAIYNKKVHGPSYNENDYILLHYPVTTKGNSPKLSSPWRGPYSILKCINDANYKIEELSTQKQLVVHYDRIKPYFGQPPSTSNIPERLTPLTTAAKPSKRQGFDNSDCDVTFQPMRWQPPTNCSFSQSFVTTTSQSETQQSQSPVHRESLLNASAPPFVPTQTADCFNTSSFQSREPSDSSFRTITPQHSTPTRVHENLRSPLGTIIDSATQQFVQRTSMPPRSLRQSTMNQRKANPLYKARLPRDLTDFLSPKNKKNAARNGPGP